MFSAEQVTSFFASLVLAVIGSRSRRDTVIAGNATVSTTRTVSDTSATGADDKPVRRGAESVRSSGEPLCRTGRVAAAAHVRSLRKLTADARIAVSSGSGTFGLQSVPDNAVQPAAHLFASGRRTTAGLRSLRQRRLSRSAAASDKSVHVRTSSAGHLCASTSAARSERGALSIPTPAVRHHAERRRLLGQDAKVFSGAELRIHISLRQAFRSK